MSSMIWNEIAKLKQQLTELETRLGIGKSADVFKMLDKGLSPIAIVKRTNIDPTVIEKWFELWLRWKEIQHAKDKNSSCGGG